jgi:hypothetical protein
MLKLKLGYAIEKIESQAAAVEPWKQSLPLAHGKLKQRRTDFRKRIAERTKHGFVHLLFPATPMHKCPGVQS